MAKKLNGASAQVKICGITNAEDSVWAANLGADFIGLNFCAESSRKVSVEKAAEAASALPPFVKTVGIFVQQDLFAIEKILKKVPLQILQFHGLEDAAFVQQAKEKFGLSVWKAVHVQDESSVQKIADFVGVADAIVLDAHSSTQMGGTGQTFNWNLAKSAKEFGIPIVLSGGLNGENVRKAIATLEPWAVDAASGVEKAGHPRKKDVEKMKEFILAAK